MHGGYLHTVPLLRGRVVTAVLQWTGPTSTLAVKGDNGTFSETRQSHVDILSTFGSMLQLFLDRFQATPQWQKSHPGLKKNMRSRMKMQGVAALGKGIL